MRQPFQKGAFTLLDQSRADMSDAAGAVALKPVDLATVAREMGYIPDADWGWVNYKRFILTIGNEYGRKRHLEIGGGRNPLFSPADLAKYGFQVTINDISANELALAGPEYAKVQCDIASDEALSVLGHGRYDFAYCFMVMEHVRNVRRMWENVYGLLAQGGVALSFFPTLYAPPFVINRLLPETFARKALHSLFPQRTDTSSHPKFPAHYNYCRSGDDVLPPLLSEIGFTSAMVLPTYGHSYFVRVPGLKQADAGLTRLARRKDWRLLSTYAYVLAVK